MVPAPCNLVVPGQATPTVADGGLALLTGEAATGLLATALGAGGGELLSWRPRQVAHQPGGPTTVTYSARARWPGGADRDETLVASTGEAPPGALVLDDGEERVAVWRFPHDPHLPALRLACDQEALAGLLPHAGLGGPPTRLRVRAYRPGRRAVVEVTGPRGRAFVKVVHPDEAGPLHERHRVLAGAGVPVPAGLGWSPEGLVALQALPGITLRRALVGRAGPVPSGRALRDLLDRLPGELAQGPARQSWSEKAPHYAAVVGEALPGEAVRASRVAAALAAETVPVGTGPVHGDFYEAQVMVEGDRVCGLLDVDTVGAGDSLDDLACLIGHLSVLAQVDDARAPAIGRAQARYLADFDRAVAPDQLRYRIAAVVLSLATGPHRVQEPAWQAATRKRLELAEWWLSRARAATPGAGAPASRG